MPPGVFPEDTPLRDLDKVTVSTALGSGDWVQPWR